MAKVIINPGICGLETEIKVVSEDMQNVEIVINSDCPYVKKLAEEIKELDGFSECFAPFGESVVFKKSKEHIKHGACPVPTGIIKAIEIACGLALPKDVVINMNKE